MEKGVGSVCKGGHGGYRREFRIMPDCVLWGGRPVRRSRKGLPVSCEKVLGHVQHGWKSGLDLYDWYLDDIL